MNLLRDVYPIAMGAALVTGAALLATDTAAADVVWCDINTQNGSSGDVLRYARSLGTQQQVIVAGGLVDPYGIAYDPIEGRIYWTEVNGDVIKSAYLDGSDQQVILATGSQPTHIAIDPVNRRMYWGENPSGNGDRIRSAGLDGSGVVDVVTGQFTGVLGIALDWRTQTLYWSDRGSGGEPMIGTVETDGSNFQVLLDGSDGLSDPAGIVLDDDSFYWVDAGAGVLGRADRDGTNSSSLVTGLADPHGIALSESSERVYWTDFADFTVNRIDTDGTGRQLIADTGVRQTRGIVAIPGTGDIGDGCIADLDFDMNVGFSDLLAVLSSWGPCM